MRTYHKSSVKASQVLQLRALCVIGGLVAGIVFLPAHLSAQSSPLTIQPSTGRVGIGTTTPDGTLAIQNGTSDPSLVLRGRSSDGQSAIRFKSNVGTTEHVVIYNIGDHLILSPSNSGNVGIGTTSPSTPSTKLDVNGTLTATTKNFKIAHPLEPDKKVLIHSALEGPELAVYYRGEAKLKDGEATVALPSYFEALTHTDQRTVQVTPVEGWAPLYVEGEVKEGVFKIRTAEGGDSKQRFYWEVKAVRKDVALLVVEEDKDADMKVAKKIEDRR